MQVERQVTSRLETLLGILFQAVKHDAIKRGRDLRIGGEQIGGIFLENGTRCVRGSRPLKGATARKHFVEHGAEGKNVGTRISRLSAHLFWRHITSRAQDR